MFVELLPLLAKRSLAITMCATSATDVHLTIQPRPAGKADKDEKIPDPYVASGPAADVDEKFVTEIAGYTKTVLAFYSSLDEVKASTDATLKEVKDEAAKKVAEAKKTGKVGGTSGASAVNAKVAAAVKPEPAKAPEPPSLFDAIPAQAAVATEAATVQAPAVAVAASVAEDEDNDPDDDPCGSDDEDEASEEISEDIPNSSHIPVIAPAVIQDSQSSMFATTNTLSAIDEEEEQLQEAFYGDQAELAAA